VFCALLHLSDWDAHPVCCFQARSRGSNRVCAVATVCAVISCGKVCVLLSGTEQARSRLQQRCVLFSAAVKVCAATRHGAGAMTTCARRWRTMKDGYVGHVWNCVRLLVLTLQRARTTHPIAPLPRPGRKGWAMCVACGC